MSEAVTINLANPIKRKGGDLAEITLRRPKAGALRGLKVEDLYSTDVNALMVLLPRITEPTLIMAEVEELETEDLLEIAGTVKAFFWNDEMKAAVAKVMGAPNPDSSST
ncbi:MAG: phage tail assembly protein [Novosphingobium sp.]